MYGTGIGRVGRRTGVRMLTYTRLAWHYVCGVVYLRRASIKITTTSISVCRMSLSSENADMNASSKKSVIMDPI